jgi:hypothetical protein
LKIVLKESENAKMHFFCGAAAARPRADEKINENQKIPGFVTPARAPFLKKVVL